MRLRSRLVTILGIFAAGIIAGLLLWSIQTHRDDSTTKPNILTNILPEVKSPTPMQHSTLGWIPYWDQQAAIQTFKDNVDVFDYIGVFWYAISEDGEIVKYPHATIDQSLIDYAHAHDVAVLALIANLPLGDNGDSGTWDSERVDLAIGDKGSRQQHIEEIMEIVNEYGFDGVDIDYESLRADQKEDFTKFIKDLANALHEENKILGVALHPKDSENNPKFRNGSEAQDWKSLGKYADQLHIMTYDEHWEMSDPGPVASLPWVESVLEYAVTLIPPEKIYAGVPFYGYDWSTNKKRARGLTYKQAQKLTEKYNPDLEWDDDAQGFHFHYDKGNIEHEVWFEETQSLNAKLNLFESLGIPNIATWRLGGEDPGVWDTIRNRET